MVYIIAIFFSKRISGLGSFHWLPDKTIFAMESLSDRSGFPNFLKVDLSLPMIEL